MCHRHRNSNHNEQKMVVRYDYLYSSFCTTIWYLYVIGNVLHICHVVFRWMWIWSAWLKQTGHTYTIHQTAFYKELLSQLKIAIILEYIPNWLIWLQIMQAFANMRISTFSLTELDWTSCGLKSPANGLLVRSIQQQVKYQTLYHWLLRGEITDDRWIPLTKGHQCGRCFHDMMTSCCNATIMWSLIAPKHPIFSRVICLILNNSIVRERRHGVGVAIIENVVML